MGLGRMGGAMLRRRRAKGQMRKDARLALALADGEEFNRVPAGIFGT